MPKSLCSPERVKLCGVPTEPVKLRSLEWSPDSLKPQTADIFLEDKAVTNEEEFKALRLKVGFVLQHADDQLFFPQVIDDVAFGPLNQGLSEKKARKVSEEALSNLGILELKDAFELRIIRRTEKTCHACMRSFYETAGIALR